MIKQKSEFHCSGVPKSLAYNRGMALIISLVFLLVISIAGVTVLNVSTFEERMAAGTRDKDLAFQAAEMAMLRAETQIETSIVAATGFTQECSGGLCGELPDNQTVMRWEDPDACGTGLDIWQCDKSFELDVSAVSGSAFNRQPRYFIEVVATIDYGDGLIVGNIGDSSAIDQVMIYRITAIGYGGSNESKVVLQSTYGKQI